MMRETDDGFRIAEEDLRLRGEGEVLGTRQSGLPGFRLARLEVDGDLLAAARDDARLIVDSDPDLVSATGRSAAGPAVPVRARFRDQAAAGRLEHPQNDAQGLTKEFGSDAVVSGTGLHSTVTDFARLRGWSTSLPMKTAV